ncbi:MAG TPA: SOSS complex subunit B family protein [Desulfobacteria bacterium]|nr:SOSS complex subunit B family protein [Desulfobacteria bacterium]
MIAITGQVLRILPVREITDGDTTKRVVDLIIADEFDYQRVSLWDDKAELVMTGEIKLGDVLSIKNASSSEPQAAGEKRVHAGRYARVSKTAADIAPLRHTSATKLTVLAVARPEQGQVCIAGIADNGDWIRPQGVYEREMITAGMPLFKNLCVSTLYLDTWRGRRPRKEDRFFVYSTGVEKELNETAQQDFLDRHVDAAVDDVFKRSGRSLGLIKPLTIMQVYEEKARTRKGEKRYERYIRFNFKDASGRMYRHWSCRCNAFYNAWNALKEKHRWTYGWRMLRYLRKNETYLAIGLTHSDYGVSGLEYGAYPLIVGVHVVRRNAYVE